MNPFQTTLAYTIAALTLTAILWACVRALRKRFAGEPCIGPPSQELKDFAAHSLRQAEAVAKMDPKDLTFDFGELPLKEAIGKYPPSAACTDEARAGWMAPSPFVKYVKSLSDADLWAMKGLSKPLAKIRKTEMDVRRRRNAKKAAKAKQPCLGIELALGEHSGCAPLADGTRDCPMCAEAPRISGPVGVPLAEGETLFPDFSIDWSYAEQQGWLRPRTMHEARPSVVIAPPHDRHAQGTVLPAEPVAGWDANGSPAVDDNVPAALAE